jgi:hypothetical protein
MVRLALLSPQNGASRDRTGDLLLAKQMLSQLSYGPVAREYRLNSVYGALRPTSHFPLIWAHFCWV